MYLRARVAVIVPAYNEARLLPRTLSGMPDFVDRVIVIDDASTDDTASAARAVCDPRIEVVRHDRNRGVGAAIATGYRAAFDEGIDVAAVMAGDAQMDPDDLARVIEPVARGEADYCQGDRLSHPSAVRAMPAHRWLGNHVLSRMTRLATGLPVRDSQCGYTAISARAAHAIEIDRMWTGYGYPNDVLGRVASAGLRLSQVTVRPIYADEESGIGVHHGLVVIPYVLARTALSRRIGRGVLAPRRAQRGPQSVQSVPYSQ